VETLRHKKKTQIETVMPADGMLAAHYPNGNFGSSPTAVGKILDDRFRAEKGTFCRVRFYTRQASSSETAVDVAWLIGALCIRANFAP
jgi:hypothetical protein